MTEKRFVYYEHKGADYILDTPNTELDFIEMLGDTLEPKEIVDLLNELNDENEDLKQSLSSTARELQYGVKKVQKLAKENEQLKSENNMLKVTIGRNEAYIKRLTETSEWHC